MLAHFRTDFVGFMRARVRDANDANASRDDEDVLFEGSTHSPIQRERWRTMFWRRWLQGLATRFAFHR